ncbi:hypothetical protein HRI_001630700 [Hibiscus trionum]|uniref:NB-ARC domain-containing protein n=1 Tax=Hibiscus trionum TaxID=183268 RepID=A0A9W7HMR8_HIBTR|nr:hypothetical protein HRI_001630700 [Hibiscus trionum]
MEAIISIAGAFASKAAEYTVDPTARQLSYLFKPKAKFQNLRTKVQDLKDAKERVQQFVDAANRKGEVVFDDVQRWLTEVNGKISDEAATQLQEDEEKATKRCFAGFCLDFKSRYHLSKKADKEANAITQLLAKKDSFNIDNAVSYLPPVEVTYIIRPEKGYEAFESRSAAFDGVTAALKDDAVGIIGVFGMGGLELEKDPSEHVRAARICDRLKKAKKILVILDDLWKEQEVDTLGIPSADQHKGCKTLITSRSLDVLKRMDSRHNISIDILKEEEAWNLFKKMAGPFVESSNLQSTAVEIAKRCAGLPIAIATIAKALKPKEDLCEWEDALRRLSKPSQRNFKGIPAKAYSAIELSYKFLQGEELGPIFLLCSIMGHDADVEDLLRYAFGLGFIHDVHTMKESRDSVLTLVNNLKASCLLLEGSRPNRFDTHDVVRDVAQSIASRDLHWLVLTKEWPDEEKMKESQLISLQNVEDSELFNHELECPNLDYFSVGLEGSSSLKISENFFKGMQRLKVLEFRTTNLRALPSSIGCLKTLCKLRLRGCVFKDIGILGELGNLEILDLSSSTMKMLPKEIGQLMRLKLLDLSDCYDLEVISPNVLSKLSRLEELYLYDSFDGWEVEGIENPRRNSSLVELQHLPRLTTLEVHIPDVEAIPKGNLFLGKMERYKVSIGDEKWAWHHYREMKASRMLMLKMNKSIHLVDGIKLLLGKTQSLYLDGLEDVGEMQMLCHPNVESFGQLKFMKVKNCNMLKNLFSFSIAKRLCQLEGLEVSNCKNITELIAENEEIDENDILEFNKLRILKLENLQSFNGLLYSENTPQSSPSLFDKKVSCPALEELKVKRCDDKLKHVFTSSMVKSFVHLKKLEVSECEGMEGVIEGTLAAEEGISSSIRVFSKLDYLDLDTLPKLREFCCGINLIEFPLLRRLEIQNCHDLKTFVFDDVKSRVAFSHCLFNEKVIFPVLEELKIENMDNLERLWPDLLVENSFSRLTSIDLLGCPKLLNVFPLSMLTRLQRLDKIYMWNCESVEEIIFGSEYRSQGGSSSSKDVITFEFPALTSLALNYLPKLKSIHHNKMHTINWPSLKQMKVRRCRAVGLLFAYGETSSEQPLFWVNEVSYPVLEELKVEECHKLKYVFTSSSVKSFVHLKTLRVFECEEMEGVIEGTLAAEEGISSNIKVFSKLDSLILEVLPKLRRFCCGINPIEFLSLKRLLISECYDLNTFVFDDGKNIVTPPRYLFNEKVILPELEELEIRGMGNSERLWPDLLVEHSFSSLTSIELKSCHQLLNVFPLSMLTRLQMLNRLNISYCHSVEELISESVPQEGGSSSAMPSLSPQFMQSNVNTFEFPALTSLELLDMPNLRSIHHNKMHTINWPSLKQMRVRACRAVEILFASGETSSEQPLFWVNESTFPNIYQLTLESNAGMKEMIWHCQGQQQHQLLSPYFPNLKVVKLEWYPEQVTVLPSYLFHLLSLPTLQTLEISCCSFKEMIFQSEEGGEEKPASLLLSQITELRLFYLTKLMHLWKEKEGFPNLWFLYVEGCSGLKANLVPSSVSFRNLVNFKVSKCHKIVKLITHSTAKSLVQLKQMSIKSCENIEEIMQGGDDDDEICFPQLSHLKLVDLPKLESFCSSEKHTFKFRSLEYLKVYNCPNMKMFSRGVAHTPLLHKVQIHDYRNQVRWEGSLNSTIQELFREKHTIWTSSDSEESENYEEECETKEDQDNPSTSNTQAITEIAGDDTTR